VVVEKGRSEDERKRWERRRRARRDVEEAAMGRRAEWRKKNCVKKNRRRAAKPLCKALVRSRVWWAGPLICRAVFRYHRSSRFCFIGQML
jgi:hypothetical protein